MDLDSQNITPPDSPIIGYSGSRSLDKQLIIDSEVIFCLDCKGVRKTNDHSFSAEGFILRREVITAIDSLSENAASSCPPRLLKWCNGNLFDPLDKGQLKIMIAICRKAVSSLEVLSESSNSYHSYDAHAAIALDDPDEPRNQSPWLLRQRVCRFLNFIVRQLKYYRVAWNREEFESIFIGLKKSLGSTKEWSGVLKTHCGSTGGNQCSSASYHFFHLQLELRWCLLLIFGLKETVIQWVLDDLIYLALSNYPNMGNAPLDKKQPCNCCCVNEIWVMIRLLLDELQPQQKSFWTHYGEAMQRCSKDNAFFPIWLTAALADTGNYTVAGVYAPRHGKEDTLIRGDNGYTFLRGAFKEWVNRGGKSADILKLSLGIFQQWGGDYEIVSSLWTQYVPRLDRGSDITNFQPFSNVDSWLRVVYEMCEDDPAQRSCRNESEESYLNSNNDPFFHFIRLVGSYAKSCSLKDFKRLTSNLCMKLSSNRTTSPNDFGELGIIRVSTLFLVLTYVVADVQEAVSLFRRLQDIFVYDKAKNTPGRRKSILRAQSTMLILLLQKKFNISEVASPYMKIVDKLLCDSASSSTISAGEPSKKDLIMVYIDLLDNVSKYTPSLSPDQNLGRSTMISTNFMMWLPNCGPNYVVRTARMLSDITNWVLSWIRSQSDSMTGVTASSLAKSPSEAKDLLIRIKEKSLLYFKSCVTQNSNRIPATDMKPVAKLVGDVTILITKLSQGTDKDRDELFDLFATGQITCPIVSQFYVNRLFKHKSFIENSFTRVKWAQAWIRLIALDCLVPDGLTELILGTHFASTSNSELLKHFCRSEWSKEDLKLMLSQLPDLLTGIMNGTYFKERDLSDSEKVISSVITTCVTLLKNIRFDLLYIRGFNISIAHQLLNLLVPPPWPGTPLWEKWATPVLNSVEENLFDVFKSVINSIGYAQDHFLCRKIEHIVVLAVFGFVREANEVDKDVHPAFTILNYCEDAKLTLVQNEILPNVVAGDIVLKNEKLYQLFVRAVSMIRLKRFPTLVLRLGTGIIRAYLMHPEMGRSALSQCLNSIAYCVIFGDSGSDFKTWALEAFTNAMNREFAFNSRRCFTLFEALVKFNSADKNKSRMARAFLKTELLPIIIKNVELTEARRGGGRDTSLRNPLQELQTELIKLGV